ncbi:hypothetical protein [Streptomyces sp. NPDC048669]|uniref:hypothetical protein n=1 Tax=Streptomyces sp. NPDC048669 TaxID=3155267 RepID=UPI00343266EE
MNTVAVPLAGSSPRGRLALVACAPAHRGDDASLVRHAEELRRSAALLGPAGRAPAQGA